LLRLVIILAWSMAILGIATWTYSTHQPNPPSKVMESTPASAVPSQSQALNTVLPGSEIHPHREPPTSISALEISLFQENDRLLAKGTVRYFLAEADATATMGIRLCDSEEFPPNPDHKGGVINIEGCDQFGPIQVGDGTLPFGRYHVARADAIVANRPIKFTACVQEADGSRKHACKVAYAIP
jgi:hypothetical protein